MYSESTEVYGELLTSFSKKNFKSLFEMAG